MTLYENNKAVTHRQIRRDGVSLWLDQRVAMCEKRVERERYYGCTEHVMPAPRNSRKCQMTASLSVCKLMKVTCDTGDSVTAAAVIWQPLRAVSGSRSYNPSPHHWLHYCPRCRPTRPATTTGTRAGWCRGKRMEEREKRDFCDVAAWWSGGISCASLHL